MQDLRYRRNRPFSMKDLISNVFALECFPIIYEHCKIKGRGETSYKWKNLMKSYPLFVKRYHLERKLLNVPLSCVTLGGMYFFYFLSFCKNNLGALKEFLNTKQGIISLEEYIMYDSKDSQAIFTGVVNLSGNGLELVSNKPFNESLRYLIESYQIIPQNAAEGIIWVLNKERDDLCRLETILKTYSGFMG